MRPESGQDAFFVARLGDTGGVALGVADGVGGWMDSGVDPADFSHTFCHHMAAAAHTAPAGMTARQLMQKGYDAVVEDHDAVVAGGSTASVGLLTPDGVLDVANLGDSGFIVLRASAVAAFSEPQVHAFNTPYQLSVVPQLTARRQAAFGQTQLADLPSDAEVSRHALSHGDVLVFASDGLWDNLFNQDVLRIVARAMSGAGAWVADGDGGTGTAPDLGSLTDAAPSLQATIAADLTGAAKAASTNTRLDGPFAKEVKKYYPRERWQGGKADDICVVVAVAAEEKEITAKL
jgi:protein phosphatase PTC7